MILVAVALGVLYYLYITLKEYLSNETNQNRFMQAGMEGRNAEIPILELSFEDKVRKTEFGTLVGILGYIANADGAICPLEKEVAKSMFDEMAQEMSKLGEKEELCKVFESIFEEKDKNIQELCERFCDLTKGEYKKKLKVVEFCFVLGYADGELNEATKEAIIDVAALLELDNQDFNDLYDDFAKENSPEISLEEAKELFGNTPKEELHQKYLSLIAEHKQSPTEENLQNFSGRNQLLQLQKIHRAYEMLKNEEQN